MTVISTNIRDQLGKSGSFVLSAAATNGFTRTHAGSGYRRINPFEVQAGRAPHPVNDGPPWVTTDWEGYNHDLVPGGVDLEVSVGYGEATLQWVRPSGYTLATGILRQLVYAKSMGTSEDLNVNPFSSPDDVDDAGDGTSWTMTGLTPGDFYAFGVKPEFDDSVSQYLPVDGLACAPESGETPLLGAGRGISSGVAVFADAPTISVVQLTDESTCAVGDDVVLRVTLNMVGPSLGTLEQQQNGGSWSTVDSSISAGTSFVDLSRASPHNWGFRVSYNSVGVLSNTATASATCILL